MDDRWFRLFDHGRYPTQLNMPPETYTYNSRSFLGSIGMVLSGIIGCAGYLSMPYNWLGWLLLPVGALGSLFFLSGLLWPMETGCSVDDTEIRWWTARPARIQRVLLKDIDNIDRISLDSSWIDISTTNGTNYTIPDSYTGETDRIYRSLAMRLENKPNAG